MFDEGVLASEACSKEERFCIGLVTVTPPQIAVYLRPESYCFIMLWKAYSSRLSLFIRTMATITKLRDPNTLSNYDKFRTRHIAANFKINFEKKRLEGNVVLNLEVLDRAKEVVLDSSFVDLQDVTLNGSAVKWKLEERSEPFGSPLKVEIGDNIEIGKEIVLDVSQIKEYDSMLIRSRLK